MLINRKKVKFVIHFNGEYKDDLIISGEMIEEIRKIASAEISKRGWDEYECWGEKIKEEEPSEPCKSCPYADWIDMYGKMVYGCDMSYCYLSDIEELLLW